MDPSIFLMLLIPYVIISLFASCMWNIVYIITFITVSAIWITIFGMMLTVIEIPLILQTINPHDIFIIGIGFILFCVCASFISCMINCISPTNENRVSSLYTIIILFVMIVWCLY